MSLLLNSFCAFIIIQTILMVVSLPVHKLPPALEHEYEQTPTGYRFKYSVGDGTIREEIGDHKTPDGEDKPMSVKGYYSYYLDDGSLFTVVYTADETGYHTELNTTKEGLETFILNNEFSINPNCLKSLCGGGK